MAILSFVIGIAIPAGIIAAIVLAIRRRGQGGPASGARGVRRFFQYLLLFALIVVAAIGATDLLGRLLGSGDAGGETLARTLAFTIVGVPLAALLGWWTVRSHREDPAESEAPGFAAYLTLTALTALVVTMVGLQTLISRALLGRFDAGSLATALVWGALWLLHWTLARRILKERGWPHLLLGSIVGLGTSVVAVALLAGASLEILFLEGGDQFVVGTGRQLAGYGATLTVGVLAWARYWLTAAAHLPRTTAWLAYVLPVGVGGGLLLALGAGSVLLWHVLVWILGDPFGPSAGEHFENAPLALSFALAGLVAWWYHRSVIAEAREERTEARRVHEYIVSAIGLLAAASGVGMVIVAAIESFTPGLDLGTSTVNTLLGAITILLVGVPVWWWFWSRIGRARQEDPAGEVASPTRRTYLVALFGIAGVAAVIALLVAVFILFQDVLAGQGSSETFRAMRYAIGVLVATAAVSAYHGAVYREDREIALPAEPIGPRSVLLVGAPSPGLEDRVRRATGARVELLIRSGDAAPPWSEETLLATLAEHPGEDLLVLADADVLRVITVHGRR